MEGYMDVWQGFFTRWTKCYFRIQDDTVLFGPSIQQLQNKVHLKVAQIISVVDDPITFILHTGTEAMRLRTSSIDERVKWFKKLKKAQKDTIEANQIHQRQNLGTEAAKNKKLQRLAQIRTDLWRLHADLENQIDDLSMRLKPTPAIKNLSDKLRMTVQSIKIKSSQALKIMDLACQKGSGNIFYEKDDYEGEGSFRDDPEYTQYKSFDEQAHAKLTGRRKKMDEMQPFSSLHFKGPDQLPISSSKHLQRNNQRQSNDTPEDSFSSNFKQTPIRMISSSRAVKGQHYHQIKQRLFDTNPVFMEVKKNLTSNKLRQILPEKFTPEEKFPLGSVLKGAIGSDLTKFALPVTINEPLSVLQKGCEQMYYSKLLDAANEQQTPEKRMLYVATFLISQYSLTDMRVKKPFNPLLGETFQLYDKDRHFLFYSEQVSHHPPISAMNCLSDNFQVFDQSQAKSTFTGASIKVIPEGRSKLRLYKYHEEIYKYNKCPISINNVLMGKTNMEISGQLMVQCKAAKTKAIVEFREQGFWNRTEPNQVEGRVELDGKLCYTLSGKWNDYVKATDAKSNTTKTLWTRTHETNPEYYYFNDYAMILNHLNRQNLAEVAPTDSRLRPDQRALEYRNLELAASEKLRLEQKQRVKRKQNEQKGTTHQIKWFMLEQDLQGDKIYVPNGNYENDRNMREWPNFPDLF